MTDLRVDIGPGDPDSIEDFARNVLTLQKFERRVLNVAERVLSHGPVNLTDFEETAPPRRRTAKWWDAPSTLGKWLRS